MPKGIYKRSKKDLERLERTQFKKGTTPHNKGINNKEEHKCVFCEKNYLNYKKDSKFCSRKCWINGYDTVFKKGHNINKGGNKKSFKKNHSPWNKGSKGIMKPWNKGLTGEEYLKHYKDGVHPSWLGGLSFEPYTKEFNMRFKRLIRKRDNQICMICSIHREKLNSALDVHHINYDKKLSIPENCISLCRNCHGKTNFNREQWIPFFQSLLSKKYGYQYEDNKPILNLEVGHVKR